jgi:hypothetical protein
MSSEMIKSLDLSPEKNINRPDDALDGRIKALLSFSFSNNIIADFNDYLRLSERLAVRSLLRDEKPSLVLMEASKLLLACERSLAERQQKYDYNPHHDKRDWLDLPAAEISFLEEFLDYYQEA